MFSIFKEIECVNEFIFKGGGHMKSYLIKYTFLILKYQL